LYATDSVLVGYVTATGRTDILKLVRGIIAQGWTGIKIKVVNARKIGDGVLVAAEYTALGSGGECRKDFERHIELRARPRRRRVAGDVAYGKMTNRH
jgi:hypothetical protein